MPDWLWGRAPGRDRFRGGTDDDENRDCCGAIVTAGCCGATSAALAGPLSIVDVGAPAVNCAFKNEGAPDCTVVVDDSIGTFSLGGDRGEARLQSRTLAGVAPAPGAGDTGCIYRVDLT